MRLRIGSLTTPVLLVFMAVVSFLVGSALSADQWVMGLQSPLSPVVPFVSPTPPQVEFMETPVRMFTAAFRTSPLPWAVAGIVLFGGLAVGAVVWARRRASR